MRISYDKFGLKEVINASGKMTILGVSKISENVLAAQRFGGEHFFEMSELFIQTGAYLAKLLKVEDAQIVSSASAGIAQSVAAIIGQGSLYHAYHPYTDRIKKREIIVPKGHNVDYGTPVEVMVELGGGEVVEAGCQWLFSRTNGNDDYRQYCSTALYQEPSHSTKKYADSR